MTFRRPIALLLLLAACGAVSPTVPRVRVAIPAGIAFRGVTDTLVAHGIVTHPLWFRIIARLRGADHRVQAGVYDLPRGQSAWVVLTVLATGRIATTKFTVPEGLSLTQLAPLAAAEHHLPDVDRPDVPAAIRRPRLE